jgi:hypothetical protein
MNAVDLARWACGGFFLLALSCGVWKYRKIVSSPNAAAPVYVDIAHRAAFMYAFSCLTMAYFADLSKWSEVVNFSGVAVAVFFFFTAESTYVIHGLLEDTENQLQAPYKLGKSSLPGALVHGYMYALIAGEVGGFLVVFTGAMLPVG